MKGLAVGLNKGFITTRISKIRERPGLRKGRLGKRVALIRQIIRESVGFAPYEKRVTIFNKGHGVNQNRLCQRQQKGFEIKQIKIGHT